MRVTRSHRPLATAAGTTTNHRPEVTGNEPVTDTAPRAPGRQALLLSSLLALVLGALALALPAAASAAYLFESKWGAAGAGAGQFSSPAGLATDSAGNIYVADTGNHRIQKFSTAGAFLATWGWGVDDGSGAFQVCTTTCEAGIAGFGAGQLAAPGGLAIDSSDNVYVADTNNNRMQKFTSAGAIVTAWGSAGDAEGEFANPRGVAVDSSDNVYVAIDGNHRIQKFSSAGSFLAAWGWGVDDGTPVSQVCTVTCQAGISGAGNGQFSFPLGVTTGPDGVVYVADINNDRIQKFNSSGTYLTKWGTNGAGNGQFLQPQRVVTDASGSVYVADTFNNRVQKFNASGTILAKWGSNGSGDGQFSFPLGVTTNAAGDVYVAGFGNNRIQKFAKGPPQATISSGPTGPTNDATPGFGFTTAPLDSLNTSNSCRVDAEPFASCTSPFTAAALADGAHSFEVRASDAEGTQDPPAMRSFSVDTVAPNTTITSGADGATGNASPSFGFSANESPSTFACSLDSAAFSACPSPKAYSNLTDGPHSFAVRATDAAGNTDGTPAERKFTVDTEVSGSASAKKTQKQKGNKIKVKVKVKPDEDLSAKATGKVKLGRRSYKLKPKSADAAADEKKNLALAPRRSSDAKKIAKALKQGEKAKAKLTVTLTDELGNTKTQKLGAKLKR